MATFVAIDIETTGLDPRRDAIIEIGAVRFRGEKIEDEWSVLVNPQRPVPSFITQLTHITNDMVMNAPLIKSVLPELAVFVDQAAVVGHNIRFDLSFLQRHGILMDNPVWDTYEMASVLLPGASRYNLGALSQSLNIDQESAHRALDDARASGELYLRMAEKARELPMDLLAEIVRLSDPYDWIGGSVFQQALRERSRQPIPAKKVHDKVSGPLFGQLDEAAAPLQPKETPIPLDIDEASAVIELGGPFSKYFSGYEFRPQQVEMLKAVGRSLSEGQHLMVEAGTGTGKSFAYLVPSALWAVQNQRRVVISTNTINLQDQLIKKDIPDLKAALGLDLRAVVMKGRGNYLCPRRLEAMRMHGPETVDELRVLAKVLVWMHEGASGDRGDINLNGPAERDAWAKLNAEDDSCKIDTCIKRTGGDCPFFRARQAAQSAHLIVVNHALLLADIATNSRVLPEYDNLIVDEAHHLEEATTSALSFRVSQFDLERTMRELGGSSSGLLGRFLNLISHLLQPSEAAAQNSQVTRATDFAFRFENAAKHFYQEIDRFITDQRDGNPIGSYAQQVRVLPATHTQPGWMEVEIAWENADDSLKELLKLITSIYQSFNDFPEEIPEELENVQGNLGNMLRRLTEIEVNVSAMVNRLDPDKIYWVEVNPNGGRITLQVAPLHIGKLMEEYLWHKKSSVIMTSATLTTAGDFDYLRGRLNADEADELALGSPFDFETAALLYLVNDIPDPTNSSQYQNAVESALIRLCKATSGRTLVLFTSYSQLKKTSQVITPALTDKGIAVFEQGEGASANALLENFKSSEQAVLLGTRSFWEGVDIPGAALSVVVMVKLPFDVPSDPIVAARSETFEDPFNEYSIPEAILRFRQGFGRLIRTQSDRGVVAILDRRILTKKYGKIFLDSLPECTKRVGTVMDLPQETVKWLNL
jgi:DNA polymerase-3 subunit epsilon/ATP-dependent DNA helicase DinG